MARSMKVYVWTGFTERVNGGGQRNCKYAMAAPSKAEVNRITGKKPHDFYSLNEVGPEHSVSEAALAKPGTVFIHDTDNHTPGENVWVEVAIERIRRR